MFIYYSKKVSQLKVYTIDAHLKGLSYSEVQNYLYTYGITEIPIISKFDASGRVTVREGD